MAILARDVAIDETRAVEIPDVHYARSGDIAIAYQIVGDGPPDIIFVRAIAGDLLSTWEQPLLVRQLDVFASVGRLLFGAYPLRPASKGNAVAELSLGTDERRVA